MTKLPGTATLAESVELAVVTRGGFVESRHAGSAIVLSPEGDELLSIGKPEGLVFTRSALKPVQLITMLDSGLKLANNQELTIAMASHNGSHDHAKLVWQILSAGRLDGSALLCPAEWPMGGHEARTHAASGGKRNSMLHPCSGKHAAMLRTCQANAWSLDDYTAHDHPLQIAIKETVQRFTGEAPIVAVDGCGAPTLAVSLSGLARAIRRMATSKQESPFAMQRNSFELLQAARQNGWIIGGQGTGDTTLIDELNVFSKFGAEGTLVVATPDGHVVAVRVIDGSTRSLHAIAVELLRKVGAITDEAADAAKEKLNLVVFGGGSPVGEIIVSETIISD